MDRLIKIFAGLLITVTIGLLWGVGYLTYRLLFGQPAASASALAVPTSIPQGDWKALKSDAQIMKEIFLAAVKSKAKAGEMETEIDNTWESLNFLEKEGEKITQLIAGDFERRVQEGTRTEAQVQEAMRDLAKQHNLAMVYIYGHLWPTVLQDLAAMALNLDGLSSAVKFGSAWRQPLPLEPFVQAAADLRVWPLQNNLLSRRFGESTTVEIYSR